MNTPRFGLVALGGTIGTGLRWAALELSGDGSATAVVLVLNLTGSFLIGVLVGVSAWPPVDRFRHHWLLIGVGFCGGLTTFATFAVQVAERLRAGETADGLGHTAITMTGAVAAAAVGRWLSGRIPPS